MRSRSVGVLVVVAAVLLAGTRDGIARQPGSGAVRATTGSEPIVPPPTIPVPERLRVKRHRGVIPEGFLAEEARASVPLTQPGVYWVRDDGPDLPPLLSPCGGRLASDRRRVDGRQLVLIGPTLWKAGRLVVYRDVEAAKAAVAEIRRALRRCERHQNANGETTIWTSQPLTIGDEALFVGGQQFLGTVRVPGVFRGLVMREGRAVQVYLDCGQATDTPTPGVVDLYGDDARALAEKLARARWAQSS
jgi:hypothetical protein